jgi:hypothetical protein
MHTDGSPLQPTLSWRKHCVACGSKKAKRWGEGRTTLAKFCPNEACGLHGIPHLVAVKTVVTIDRLGRQHVAHKETAIRRRPTFTSEPTPA